MNRINGSLRAQLWLCATFFFMGQGVSAEEVNPPDPVDAVWQRVEDLELWNDPGWWTLGHYHRTLWGRVVSRIDDSRFFIHPEGKTDRKLEIKATLEAFMDSEAVNPTEERSIPCRFPARRKWLLQKLELPEAIFPQGDCEAYHEALTQLQIERAVVVYPSAYLNSPASMFGHLLLVLDRKGKDRLLSRAVNYAAVVGDSFGPLFAVKGIFGLYDGVYTLLPYYDKVEEYSAVNRRDIWEFPLDLSEDELDTLLRHVWELQELKSRYFFFKENCAFNLLYPIEAARPSLAITRRFRTSAVPVSILQQLTDAEITGEPVFRPSKTTVMRAIAETLTETEKKRALELAQGAEVSEAESAMVLSLAVELTQYRYTEQELPPDEYRKRIFPLLRARSRLGKVELPKVDPPLPPSSGHAPQRVDLYAGNQFDAGSYTGFRWRAAYHDELDDPRGYPPGSSITFFGLDIRTSPGNGSDTVLHQFSLIDIRSLSPPELWVKPLSWAVSIRTESDPFNVDHHRTLASFATGYTWELPDGNPVYVMLGNDLRFDSDLSQSIGWEPGVQWGIRTGGHRFRAGIKGFHQFGVWGSSEKRQQVKVEIRTSLNVETSLSFTVSYLNEGQGRDQTHGSLGILRTF